MTPGAKWTIMLPSPLVKNLATLGPLGFWGKAPGTIGSVAGIIWYTAAFHMLDPLAYILLLLASLYFAVAICGEAEVRMVKRDPGEVILDEFVAIPVCFLGLQQAINSMGAWAWIMLVVGFALFRLFDILKPFGISKLQDKPGGWGVVADDVAAALATCLVLHIGWIIYVSNF